MQKNIDVYSVQIAQWRKVPKDIAFFDITVKSGFAAFAPLGVHLWMLKRGEMDEDRYEQLYCLEMERRIFTNPIYFKETLEALVEEKKGVAFACYCRQGKFCHRLLLIQKVLPKMAGTIGLTFTYKGELPL